jgi:RimJ/RimL family protein N-acetyltransferase
MPTTAADVPSTLQSGRLVLRKPGLRDASAITSLAGDWEVARHTARIPHPYGLADAEAFLDAVERGWAAATERVFAITEKSFGSTVGMIGIDLDPRHNSGEVGFWLGRPYWGRGYMTEALGAVLHHAFEDLGLTRVRASARPENLESIRVQEKAGMTLIGEAVEDAPARGRSWRVAVREIVAENARS